jgi:hypothetical protein
MVTPDRLVAQYHLDAGSFLLAGCGDVSPVQRHAFLEKKGRPSYCIYVVVANAADKSPATSTPPCSYSNLTALFSHPFGHEMRAALPEFRRALASASKFNSEAR